MNVFEEKNLLRVVWKSPSQLLTFSQNQIANWKLVNDAYRMGESACELQYPRYFDALNISKNITNFDISMKFIYICKNDNFLDILSINSFETVKTFQPFPKLVHPTNLLYCFAFKSFAENLEANEDNTLEKEIILTVSNEAAIKVWDLGALKCIKEVETKKTQEMLDDELDQKQDYVDNLYSQQYKENQAVLQEQLKCFSKEPLALQTEQQYFPQLLCSFDGTHNFFFMINQYALSTVCTIFHIDSNYYLKSNYTHTNINFFDYQTEFKLRPIPLQQISIVNRRQNCIGSYFKKQIIEENQENEEKEEKAIINNYKQLKGNLFACDVSTRFFLYFETFLQFEVSLLNSDQIYPQFALEEKTKKQSAILNEVPPFTKKHQEEEEKLKPILPTFSNFLLEESKQREKNQNECSNAQNQETLSDNNCEGQIQNENEKQNQLEIEENQCEINSKFKDHQQQQEANQNQLTQILEMKDEYSILKEDQQQILITNNEDVQEQSLQEQQENLILTLKSIVQDNFQEFQTKYLQIAKEWKDNNQISIYSDQENQQKFQSCLQTWICNKIKQKCSEFTEKTLKQQLQIFIEQIYSAFYNQQSNFVELITSEEAKCAQLQQNYQILIDICLNSFRGIQECVLNTKKSQESVERMIKKQQMKLQLSEQIANNFLNLQKKMSQKQELIEQKLINLAKIAKNKIKLKKYNNLTKSI